MFINKSSRRPIFNSQEMSSYVNSFLKSEITCIPRLFSNYLGDYYNNALCNGATWVFALWCILHSIFDRSAEVFMKKLRYREYVRTRLKSSLWYLGFYGTAVVYCGATLTQNEVELFNFKKMHVPSINNLPTQVILGYTLIVTFYLHSSLWEGLSKGYVINMFNYLFLFAFMVSSYILRIVEISFTLTALISVAQVSLEFTRCCFMSSIQKSLLSKIFIGFCYITTFLIYLTVHVIVVPLTFLVPLGLKILTDYPNMLLMFLYCNLFLWFLTEIYHSIAFKLADHWLYHKQICPKKEATEHSEIIDSVDALSWCSSTLLECSLFSPRDDDSYNFMIMREEIKARRNKMLSLRKPKNMFLQTLKCMVAIKRKLSEKRLSESSDSDSEKSENSDLKMTSDNTDDEIELHSDDESNNEDSDSQECDDVDVEEQKSKHKEVDILHSGSDSENTPEKIDNDYDKSAEDLATAGKIIANTLPEDTRSMIDIQELDKPCPGNILGVVRNDCKDPKQCIDGEILDSINTKKTISSDDFKCAIDVNREINKDKTHCESKVQVKSQDVDDCCEKQNPISCEIKTKDYVKASTNSAKVPSEIDVHIESEKIDNSGRASSDVEIAQTKIDDDEPCSEENHELCDLHPNHRNGGEIHSASSQNEDQVSQDEIKVGCDECSTVQSHLSAESTNNKLDVEMMDNSVEMDKNHSRDGSY